jgi:hypothetical protein
VDYRRDSGNLVAARLFRSEYKSKLSEDRQLDSYAARNCCHTRRIEPPWSDLKLEPGVVYQQL